MEILFGLIVVVLLYWGLRNRKKEKKEWLGEERYDESGAWLDKRAGERGTYGSLDDEMEQARQSISRQGKASELAQRVRTYFFEQHPGFHDLSDAQIRQHITFSKSKTTEFVLFLEKTAKNGHLEDLAPRAAPPSPLQKELLSFAFDSFSALLDLPLEDLKKLDSAAQQLATTLSAEAERLSSAGP
jgi:hypothetical protein